MCYLHLQHNRLGTNPEQTTAKIVVCCDHLINVIFVTMNRTESPSRLI